MTVKKRLVPTLVLVAALAVGLAACGDDAAEEGAPDPSVSLPGVPSTDGGVEHPTGSDAVIVSYSELGGFTTPEVTFQQTPSVLISGDGLVYTPGAQIAVFPGPLLPTLQVQTITEAAIQTVLAAAEENGLFGDVDYEAPTNVADATTSTVVISANGETWTHEAYALTLGADIGASTPERRALLDFIMQLTDLMTLVGAENLGETSMFEPTEYAIEAIPIDDLSAYGGDGIEPTVIEWPTDVSVRLADASSCVTLPAAEIGELLAAANQLTFFTDADVTYQVVARPVPPGSTC
jgi:hypothetical protein